MYAAALGHGIVTVYEARDKVNRTLRPEDLLAHTEVLVRDDRLEGHVHAVGICEDGAHGVIHVALVLLGPMYQMPRSHNLLGEHKDINDEGQTVTFPQLHTNASDGITGNHIGTVSEKATVIDTVTYTGLLPGKEYTVKGTRMEKETGEPVKDSKGKEITAEKTFTAEKADGSVELAFTFDSTALKNSAVVVFERLYVDDKEVAAHTDINDKGQTVEYTEHKIQTQAKDKESGSQEAKTSGTASVKTGDEAPIAELFGILVFSGVVTAVMVKKKRSKRRRHLKP